MKILLTAILMVFIFTGCNDKEVIKTEKATEKIKKEDTLKKAPKGITLTDTSGNDIKVKKLEDGFIFKGYEGKIVLLNFFATWCPPCKAKIPHLNSLQDKYKDDIKIISVLLEDHKSNEDVISFINSNNIEFTITNSQDNFKIADEVGGVKSIPLMFIYDRDGKYARSYVGVVYEEMIEADIKKIL